MRYRGDMRTTVNLDDDVSAAVDRLRSARGLGVSEAVNELARQGMNDQATGYVYRHRTRPLGIKMDISDIGDVLDYLDQVEDEDVPRAR